jgi:hypothetical protein
MEMESGRHSRRVRARRAAVTARPAVELMVPQAAGDWGGVGRRPRRVDTLSLRAPVMAATTVAPPGGSTMRGSSHAAALRARPRAAVAAGPARRGRAARAAAAEAGQQQTVKAEDFIRPHLKTMQAYTPLEPFEVHHHMHHHQPLLAVLRSSALYCRLLVVPRDSVTPGRCWRWTARAARASTGLHIVIPFPTSK